MGEVLLRCYRQKYPAAGGGAARAFLQSFCLILQTSATPAAGQPTQR
jgi:hypothetical protein